MGMDSRALGRKPAGGSNQLHQTDAGQEKRPDHRQGGDGQDDAEEQLGTCLHGQAHRILGRRRR